jgi:dTDP-4-dehydrorhamnose 3,5-epimerase
VKIFRSDQFQEYGLDTEFAEEYYTISKRDVIRGMHFQVPPMDHAKLIYCPVGKIKDVVLDLRRGSPTYGAHEIFELDSDNRDALYISRGLAHGFHVEDEVAVVVYKVTSSYSPEHDRGIRWDSIGYDWPVKDPVLSDRDRLFPTFDEFDSPFIFHGQ